MSIMKKITNRGVFGTVEEIVYRIKESFYSFLTILSPTLNTKARYKEKFGKKLDLNNPQTLNEKILWLKLNKYMKDPLVIQCADKYLVRDYVTSCGCEEILNDLIGVWDSADDIPWEELPNQFVLKWNFGSRMNIICTDKSKMNREQVIKQLKKWRNNKFWLSLSEMQYKYMDKKIICEKLLDEGKEDAAI